MADTISPIYATVDNGRTHMAKGATYVGSVGSYNYCITRLFAWIFGWAQKVQDSKGNTRYFEKGSYVSFLQNYTQHKEATRATLANYSDLRRLKINPDPNMGLMRDSLSKYKSDKLARKLAFALQSGKSTQAMQYLGKGADPNIEYWDRGKFGVSFGELKDYLPRDQAVEVHAFHYTPLLYSADKKNSDLTKFILSFKPNTEVEGDEYKFSRAIKRVKTDTVPMINFDNGGRRGRTRMHMDVYEQTNVLTEDEEKPLHKLHFDSATHGIRRTAHPGSTERDAHMHTHNANVTRVF